MPERTAYWFGTLLVSLLAHMPGQVLAQMVPDATLPTNSIVTSSGDLRTITGGTTVGNNLFHSFEQFSVPTGTTAAFNNALTIENILTRVTGQGPAFSSQIDGILQANGSANLFLINPNGLLFGPNAQLKLGGSFIGSTAAAVQFADGSQFSTLSSQTEPLLTISTPVGLQFAANPSPIQVQGPGHGLLSAFPFVIDFFRPAGLQVQPSQTLALVGGNIALAGGNLTAMDGRIELGSVKDSSLVTLTPDPQGFALSYGDPSSLGRIDVSNAASVDVSGQGCGVHSSSSPGRDPDRWLYFMARTLGNGNGGSLTINTSQTLALSGFAVDPLDPTIPVFPTSLVTDVGILPPDGSMGGTGDGSALTLNVDTLRVANGAFISSGTLHVGNSGPLNINAQTVELNGSGPFGASGLMVNTFGPGAGGNLNLTTSTLALTNGAQISASTLLGSPLGSGPAGNITINAGAITLSGTAPSQGSSGLFADVATDSPGGNLKIDTGNSSSPKVLR